MARRPGVIRQAVHKAAIDMAALPSYRARGVTYLDLESALVPQGVGRKAVRRTLEQLVRDCVLVKVGDVRMPHSCRPLGGYAPPANDEPQRPLPMGLELQSLLSSWQSAAA